MAKTSASQGKTPAQKKETTQQHKAKKMLRAETIANPRAKEIYAKINSLIGASVSTFDIKCVLCKEFEISSTVANDFIKRYRKKNKIYNYGSSNIKLDEKKLHKSFFIRDDNKLNDLLESAVK